MKCNGSFTIIAKKSLLYYFRAIPTLRFTKFQVHYFDMPAEVRPIRETLSDNQEEAKLTCNTVASFPETAVVW